VEQNSADSQKYHHHYRTWAERKGFSDWVLALAWIIGAFILFQITASVIAFVLIYSQNGLSGNTPNMADLVAEHLDLLFIGNSTGQILFLGLGTWFWSRLQTSAAERTSFLRIKLNSDTFRHLLIAGILIIALQPLVWMLSWLNGLIPMPEFFSNIQSNQLEMIQQFLEKDYSIWLMLFHVALVPAVCEEILYRSYVLRAFQKNWSIWPAIIVSGLFFGMYHVQLSNLIPLAFIGMILAYITWTTQSVIPAMAAHFVNNGGSILAGKYFPQSALAEMSPESMPPVSMVLISLAITGFIVYWLYNQHEKKIA